MTPTRHLVGVWNPSYAIDAMDATVAMLPEHVASNRDDPESEEVYVWWGKVRSSNRQQPMKHRDELLGMDEQLKGDGGTEVEMHLYLTDYRSLYVGHVGEITAEDVTKDEQELSHVPRFYVENGFNCDCWFQLFDIRRVVFDDTLAVIAELQKLRNTHYGDRPVSLYGGMVDLPLIVTRGDGSRYFEAGVRERLTDGQLWVEFDAQRSGVGKMEQELRENVLGEAVWNGLDPATRSFIASAESIFRAHRNDAAFDFSPMAVEFAKAFEVQVNLFLRLTLSGAPASDRLAKLDGRTVDVTSGEMWSLGALARAIAEEESLNKALKARLAKGGAEWFTASLPPILRELASLRNPAAHAERFSKEGAIALRNRLLGVGSLGTITELGRVRMRNA